jgi:hypothetical protein
MSTDLSDQIHELMERGLRPVSMADIESRAPARVTAPRRAAYRPGLPSVDDVLSALRNGSRRQRRAPQQPGQPRPSGPGRVLTRRLRWPRLAIGAAAAVTAVTLALTLSGSPSRTGGPGSFPALPNPPASAGSPPAVVSPGRHPSSASLAKAMLTAFNASADTLGYVTVASFIRTGHLTQLDQWWSWPAVPSPGQVQYVRDAFSQIPPGVSQATGPVKLTEDDGYTTITPRPSLYEQNEPARLIVVCYAGTGQTGCGWGSFNTPAGTWSQHTGVMPYIDYTPNPRGADLAQQIAQGQWRVTGQTRLRGQQAIKLAATPSGHFGGGPVYLWVSTATYLPLRMVWGPPTSYQIWNWYYLPPSKANLAHLRVPIPSGYPRSG